MNPSAGEFSAIAPLLLVAAAALAVVLVDALMKNGRPFSLALTLLGLAGAIVLAIPPLAEAPGAFAFGGMIRTGAFPSYFTIVFCTSGLLTVLLSISRLRDAIGSQGEYFALILFAVAGMILMASSGDLVVFFLGLELMSLSFYVLAGFTRGRIASNEAALKYFLLGAFATGFLLYGIALIYGATGSTSLAAFPSLTASAGQSGILLAGLALLMIGLLFKVAAVPFHMWVPDVYEGSPTTVSAFMSTAGKAAAFSGFLMIFAPGVLAARPALRDVLAGAAVLSMVTGNLIAVAQTSIKRMLAYSSIAHAGYILTGVVGANSAGSNGVLFYLMAYAMMNAGAFGFVSLLEKADGSMLTIDECAGLGRRSPLLAALGGLFMFSLAGVPPFAGFFGKYYVFTGAVEAGYTWLAIAGVLMSLVSAYYYLRLVVVMYFNDGGEGQAVTLRVPALAALVIAALALVALGVFPSFLLGLTARCF
jgi:NADH-quinone oxidoreductase subunit N